MKYFFLLCFYFSANILFAQTDVKIDTIVKNGETIEFSISSSSHFYSGNNIFILHIGKKQFKLSKQKTIPGKDIITFLIPANEYHAVTENDVIWMSYGNIVKREPESKEDAAIICAQYPQWCWCLDTFSKSLLKE